MCFSRECQIRYVSSATKSTLWSVNIYRKTSTRTVLFFFHVVRTYYKEIQKIQWCKASESRLRLLQFARIIYQFFVSWIGTVLKYYIAIYYNSLLFNFQRYFLQRCWYAKFVMVPIFTKHLVIFFVQHVKRKVR